MVVYFAPLEGITGYIYRNAYHACFSGVDKYFTPFVAPNRNRALGPKEIRDVLPENNKGMYIVPQILTNQTEYFLRAAEELEGKYGYKEVNLNLGCPSRTVVSKGKGAGFLAKTEELDAFFEEVFQKVKVKVSVKTRIGMNDVQEFCHLLEIFNRYPLHELIIHPRLQKDYYGNRPDWETFSEAVETSRNPLCYNGDIFTVEDYRLWKARFPKVERVMLGRGLLGNPMLAEELKADGEPDGLSGQADGLDIPAGGQDRKRLKRFHDRLYRDYQEVMSGEKNVLFKMKEFWMYAGNLFPEEEKCLKKIKKAQRLGDYNEAVDRLPWCCNLEKDGIE